MHAAVFTHFVITMFGSQTLDILQKKKRGESSVGNSTVNREAGEAQLNLVTSDAVASPVCLCLCAVEGSGMIIVAIILGLLLLGILGGVLYFLRKKGMIGCGRSGKQEM